MSILRDEILRYISARDPFQEKKLTQQMASFPEMAADLDAFLDTYADFMTARSVSCQELCDSYMLMVDQMTHARIQFVQTGRYQANDQTEAAAEVYYDQSVMAPYMLGLALSQFLWRHHYEVFTFFRGGLADFATGDRMMEVGPGHGLFLLGLLNATSNDCRVDVLDISAVSLAMSRDIVETLTPEKATRVSFQRGDVSTHQSRRQYDFITMGEVLEHLDDPLSVLRSLSNLLSDDGTLFMSTCANCPAIDHVYHFHTIDEIREMLDSAGLVIQRELIAASENRTREDLERLKVDIMYAAFLSRA